MQPKKHRSNILIACEACRQSKSRCNGAQPCDRRDCQADPQLCVYRNRARRQRNTRAGAAKTGTLGSSTNRRGQRLNATATRDLSSDGDGQHRVEQSRDDGDAACPSEEAYPNSITAAHHAPMSTDSSQLFYGPSSHFAFLQEIRRAILSSHAKRDAAHQQLLDTTGTETLLQRSIFFGLPHQVDPHTILLSEAAQPAVSPALAREFLETFKETTLHRLPFYSAAELDELLSVLAEDASSPGSFAATISPQTQAIFYLILAIGATGTKHTEAAEGLCLRAKRAAVFLDEVVSLQMIWYAILLADYQLQMGRPNAAYLHIGVACRKAFSFGLHKEAATASRLNSEDAQRQQQTTLWLLYFYETFQSLSMGRTSSMRMRNISCPQPKESGLITALREVAHIMEEASETIYCRKTKSLRELYGRAGELSGRLSRFASVYNVGASYIAASEVETGIESLTLHTSYYLAVMLVYRPFLVSSYAILETRGLGIHTDMWLHQACRHAVSAAQDFIRFLSDAHQRFPACRKCRFQNFFLESACTILLYDVLRQPATYAYNLSFVQSALGTVKKMGFGEPSITSLNTIRQIAQAVEDVIQAASTPVPTAATLLDEPGVQHSADDSNRQGPTANYSQTGHEANDLIDGEQIMHLGSVPLLGAGNAAASTRPDGGLEPSPVDFSNGPDFDVLTTDLWNFFPSNLLDPSAYS